MMLKRLFMMLVLPLVLLSMSALAQDKVVAGKVTDAKDGKPIAGANIAIKGTKTGTTTNVDGFFKLNVSSSSKTLIISFVGYAQQEVAITGGDISVVLAPTSSTLNDVVVVAYGTRKKSDLTGSVTSISAKDFQKGNIASSEQLLQGKVAGLQVTSGGGSAGGGSKIRIRGGASLNASNDPLIVIDGVPVESNGIAGTGNYLSTINPNDIESMSVLKDASATALYGSRASNGVLIITTKKGVKGKIKYNFNTQASAALVGDMVSVLSASQLRDIVEADAITTGLNTYKNILGTANTDWQKEIYQTAGAYDNNLSASGSLGKYVPFRLSVGYLNQEGVLKTNKFDRLSSALNLSPKFFDDHLSVNLNVKASKINNRFANEGAIGSAVSFDPTKPVYADNKYGGYFEWLQTDGKPIDLATRNPLGLLYQRNNTSEVNRLIGNVQLDYKLHFLPDLHVLVNVGIDNANGSGDDITDSIAATNYKTQGFSSHYEQKKKNTLADFSLLYVKDLKSINSKFDLLLGHSYQSFVTEVTNFASFGLDGDTIPNSTPLYLTDKPEYRLESYFSRLNFTVANKYLFTASLRRDASSKFSPANRVGYFPAFAAAWKLRDEFFKNSNVVTDLKLRLGWGITGQQDGIGYYNYLPRYSTSTNTGAQYQFGNTFYSYLRPEGYDANLKWETTTTSNLGLDFSFFKNRISGSADYFFKKTKDLLSNVPVAPGANFVNLLTINVGNVEVQGYEFTLNTTPVRNENFTWDFGFNYTYTKSKITNLLQNQDPNFKGIDVSGIGGGTGNNIGKFAVGYAPYTFNVYKQVYDKIGNPIEGLYEDINRDGIINENDRYYYKKPAPDVLVGINTQVTYKKFSLGLSAHGYFGNYLYNNYNSNSGVLRAIKNPINFIGNASVNYLETGFQNNQYLSDYYIENASFLRLDNINFGYVVGKVFNNKASMRVAASIQNVFVITKYKGLDPENASDSGVDGNIYPRPRTYSLGVSLDF